MTRLGDTVRMEGVRVFTARASYVVLAVTMVLSGVIALMIALLALPGPLSPSRVSAALTSGGDAMPVSTVGAMSAVLGILTVGHDYRFGLLRTVFTAQPGRGIALAGRLVVLGSVAAGLAFTVGLLGAVVCWLVGRVPSCDLTTLRVLAWHAGLCVLWAWLGAGLAWVVRNTGGALALLFVGPLLVEPALAVAADVAATPDAQAAVRWLPFTAARQALGRSFAAGPDTIGALAGAAVFGGLTALVLALACTLVLRRDA